MRIGIAQIDTSADELGDALHRMVECSRRAADRGVELLVFPVATLCGVTPVPPVDREGYLSDLIDALVRLIDELACPCLVPVLIGIEERPTPEALLIDGGEVRPVRLASRLDAMGAGSQGPDEDVLPEVPFHGARLGVAFTYEDLDTYDDYDYDVDVIVFLSGYGFAVDDPSSALAASLTEGRFLADAEATGAWVVGAGSLGCYDAQLFCGSSFVLAPWGELAAQAPELEEELLVCDVDPSAEGPLPDPVTPEVYDAPLLAWGALGMGTSALVRSAGAEGACVVVGDDVASQLTAVLAVDALGPLGVSALVAQVGDATRDASPRSLVRSLRLPDDAVELVDVSAAADEAEARDLLQLRLAALARRTGRVPLGSRDKTARALEDPRVGVTAARLEPFGDVYRTDLLALARTRNTISPLVSPEALARYEVPELAAADAPIAPEDRLGLIDLVLSSYLEWGRGVSDIVAERGHAGLVLAVTGRVRDLEAFRGELPLAPTISSCTLAESRGPVGLRWRDHVRGEGERLDRRIERLVSDGDAGVEAQDGDGPDALRADAPGEGEIRDLMGYLRDFSLGGAFSGLGGPSRSDGPGRHDAHPSAPPDSWNGPFSEN